MSFTARYDFKHFTYVASGALISSLCLECFKHVIPVRRSPSNPKKLISFNRLGGNNDTDNWKSPYPNETADIRRCKSFKNRYVLRKKLLLCVY